MIPEWISWLVTSRGFLPHGICLLWEPELVYAMALSNLTIGLSYIVIPAQLMAIMVRPQAPLRRAVLWLVGAFVGACGVGHIIDLLSIWLPVYRLLALWHALTAVISIATMMILPRALRNAKRAEA